MSNCWIIVPARGGSRGIPRKNVRRLGNKPLICHVLEELAQQFDHDNLIVTTDDDEIARVSNPFASIHQRSAYLAGDTATLDQVAVEVAQWLLEQGAEETDIMITIQPTSPFVRSKTVMKGIEQLRAGARSIIAVKDDRHLRWTVDDAGKPLPLYTARVNRQWQQPTFGETGGIFGAYLGDILATGTRINQPISLLIVDHIEGLDIDSYADWAVAEFYLKRKKILIRADAGRQLGMGHVYRALALAHEMAQHDLVIVTRSEGEYELGAQFLTQQPYNVQTIMDEEAFFKILDDDRPQLVILDILDTDEAYMKRVKDGTDYVVSLEDLGTGALMADIVINDLYSDLYPRINHWYGVEHAILAPHFETVPSTIIIKEQVTTILVSFGGTDPSNLTILALEALAEIGFQGQVLVVLGPGYSHEVFTLEQFGLKGEILYSITDMTVVLSRADMALTSGGRTVTEIMTLGIPLIVMCQNTKELRHTHASSMYGVINLGLGQFVAKNTLSEHIRILMDDFRMRQDMHTRALSATQNRSNQRIVSRILNAAFPSDRS